MTTALDKVAARTKTNYLIAKGELKRQPCEVCGDKKAEAHHEDYSKPDIVRWLCIKHHRALHRKPRRIIQPNSGVKNPCPICGVEVIQCTGRRPKIFCSNTCRTAHCRKKEKEEAYARDMLDFGIRDRALNKRPQNPECKEKQENVPRETIIETEIEGNIYYSHKKFGDDFKNLLAAQKNSAIIRMYIDDIKSETIPPERDTIMGRKVWRAEQEQRIKDLESQIGYPA